MSPSSTTSPALALAQGEQNFTANLVGHNEVTQQILKLLVILLSLLLVVMEGVWSPEVTVKGIDNVTLAQIYQGKKSENGPVVVTLIRFKDLTPTGPVDGLLAEGNITATINFKVH